nr:hypothetical protein [Leifsonia sp. Leaf325]
MEAWNKVGEGALARHADVTSFHVKRYRDHLAANHSESTARGYIVDLRGALRRIPGISATTYRATYVSSPSNAPAAIRRYPTTEFTAIRNAARRVVEAAHSRIHASHMEALQRSEIGMTRTVREQALYEVLTLGRPQTTASFEALGAVHPQNGNANVHVARRLMFLDPDEAFAAAVLLACHRGLNLSSVVNAAGVRLQGDDFWQIDMDKPRRGTKRFWPEFIDGVSDPKSARALRMIVECTEPARTFLASQGKPTTTLLLRWGTNGLKAGVPQTKTRAISRWVPPGTAIDFGRLRRSVPGEGVAKEPTDHDPETYLHYVKSDPVALEEHQRLAAEGIQNAMDSARKNLRVTMRNENESKPENDALIVNCSDPSHNPETRMPCTTAFYSFLDCLDCGNAATVARLIPRQLAAVTVLEQLRDALGDVWESRFARRYYQLQAMLDRYSQTELDRAAETSANHIPAILAALRHEVPA